MTDVAMPKLSDSMQDGTIVRWLVEDGAEVSVGGELMEIETDKATTTYAAEGSGRLTIVAAEGSTVAVGELIARLSTDVAAAIAPPSVGTAAAPTSSDETRGLKQSSRRRDGMPKASPLARRLAEARGLELADIIGTGPGGRIVKDDVLATGTSSGNGAGQTTVEAGFDAAPVRAATITSPPSDPAPSTLATTAAGQFNGAKGTVTVLPLTRVQQTIARRMAQSRATIPDFTLRVEIDASQLTDLRRQLRELADPAPSINDIIVKASGLALRRHPRVNAAYRDGCVELYGRANVGVAVAAERALLVPTVFDADRKGLGAIAVEVREHINAVRGGSITPAQLSAGTFTVSNLGMYGIVGFTSVINPPQAAILSVGAAQPRLVRCDDDIVERTCIELTLACDHRVLTGVEGAEFLQTLKQLLEDPMRMLL